MWPILNTLLSVLNFFVGVSLIYIVTIQDTRNEGLQGQIGSTTTTSFKGKAGRDEQLIKLTKGIGTAFFVLSLLIATLPKH